MRREKKGDGNLNQESHSSRNEYSHGLPIRKTTIQERLTHYINYTGMSDNEFGIRAGLANGAVGKIKKGSSFNIETAEKILETFEDLNPMWLFKGKGRMLIGENDISPEEAEQLKEEVTVLKNMLIKSDRELKYYMERVIQINDELLEMFKTKGVDAKALQYKQ